MSKPPSGSRFMKKEPVREQKHLQVFQCINSVVETEQDRLTRKREEQAELDKAPYPSVSTAPSHFQKHLACPGCTTDPNRIEIRRKMRKNLAKMAPNAMLPIHPSCSASLWVILDCPACPSLLRKWGLTFLRFRKYHSTFQQKKSCVRLSLTGVYNLVFTTTKLSNVCCVTDIIFSFNSNVQKPIWGHFQGNWDCRELGPLLKCSDCSFRKGAVPSNSSLNGKV